MDNQFYIIDATHGVALDPVNAAMVNLKMLLDEGYEIKRCYTTDNVFIFHIAEREEEEAVSEPAIESVIEIALDDNQLTVKEFTDEGWVVKNLYSKKVQLVKHRHIIDEEYISEIEEVKDDE